MLGKTKSEDFSSNVSIENIDGSLIWVQQIFSKGTNIEEQRSNHFWYIM